MKIIEDGIVFSNDIYRILKGNNSINFKYEGMVIPSEETIKKLRYDFFKTMQDIFGKVTIIDENDMLEGIENILEIGRFPHCIIR